MYGVIDIGSNTMRLSVYKIEDGNYTPVFHEKEFVGIAGYVNKEKNLSPKGARRLVNTLKIFKDICESISLEHLYVFATASLRNVKNSKEVMEFIENSTGLKVELISGEQEAEFDFLGATYQTSLSEGLLVDIGGGSTELVWFENGTAQKVTSIPIGSLYLFKNYVDGILPTAAEMKSMRKAVKAALSKENFVVPEKCSIVGVGGSIRGFLKIYNEMRNMQDSNLMFRCEELRDIRKMAQNNISYVTKFILRQVPERIHTLVPGMIILDSISNYYDCFNVMVSKTGVREGYLYHTLKEHQ